MTGTDLCVRLYKSVPVIFEPPCTISDTLLEIYYRFMITTTTATTTTTTTVLLLLPITLRPFQFGLGFLMVSEQYSFRGWGCQPHAHPQLSWRTDDFLSGLSPLADQSRF